MNRQLLAARLAHPGARMAQRAIAWYTAANRRLSEAEAQRAVNDIVALVMEQDHDIRAAIAARYSRRVAE